MSLARDVAYAAAAAVTSPVWLTRLLRTGKWRTDWLGRFGRVSANLVNARNPRPLPSVADPEGETRTLLIHAVSVGEVNAARRLVATLQATRPDLHIVIAATTDTGFARARELFADRHSVVRYPFDFSVCVKHFLDAVRPDAVALMELEVWPNFVAACAERRIPVCVVNGRLSERSFKRYRWLAPVLRKTFARLAAVGAQSETYADRFRAMGVAAARVRVLDTMKWDTATITDEVAGADELAAALGLDRHRPIVVAGSTGPGEERRLIEACPPAAQLVLVPRKPERFDEVARLEPGMARRTQPGGMGRGSRAVASGEGAEANKPDKPAVFLVDTMGELGKAYALADVVVVGRSFNGLGGSDPIEPVALGKATLIGPDHANFAAVVHALEAGGGLVVTDEPGEAIGRLLASEARRRELAEQGRAVIQSRQGATERYAAMIEELLPPAAPDTAARTNRPVEAPEAVADPTASHR